MTKLQSLSMRIAKLQAEFEREKALIKASGCIGSYMGTTVYLVKSTKIKAHRRRAYKAVRVKI